MSDLPGGTRRGADMGYQHHDDPGIEGTRMFPALDLPARYAWPTQHAPSEPSGRRPGRIRRIRLDRWVMIAGGVGAAVAVAVAFATAGAPARETPSPFGPAPAPAATSWSTTATPASSPVQSRQASLPRQEVR